MTTKSQNSTPFSRLSRIGIGLGLRSTSPPNLPRGTGRVDADDEWYIPYNGPYEAPREPFQRPKERDSWGDPVYGEEEDDDTALTGRELQKLYGDPRVEEAGNMGRNSGDTYGNHVRYAGKSRDRTQSSVSGRTISSMAVEPTRTSFGVPRRSTISSTQRPPVPSYVDTTGGVGESPMPQGHVSRESRGSVGSVFTFGVPGRKAPSSPKLHTNKLSQKQSRTGGLLESSGSLHRRSSSSGSRPHLRQEVGRNRRTNLMLADGQGSTVPSEEDYYNSYYSTLISSPARSNFQGANSVQPLDHASTSTAPTSPTSPSRHPYAYTFSSNRLLEGPQTAPLLITKNRPNGVGRAEPPQLTFTVAAQAHGGGDILSPLPKPLSDGIKRLKTSISTPDLHVGTRAKKRLSPLFPKGKDRWLSAETWCDALVFPRPRLKVKQDGMDCVGSGRIVSPPGSPVLEGSSGMTGLQPEGMVSRVLAHSRSLVNLAKSAETRPPEEGMIQTTIPSDQSGLRTREKLSAQLHLRPPRPKSFAQDDLALPSPVPSLARVLEEGRILNNERKEWQSQATHSFQNKRSRSVSRARSKSLTQKGKQRDDTPPSNIDFLATRAYLGNQTYMPVVSSRDQSVTNGTSSKGTFSRTSHSHSNSLVKTLSKSSKSHSRSHSRNDSWGKSALKIAKTAASVLTGADKSTSGSDDTVHGIESALRHDGTKVIRLPDPAYIHVDKGISAENTPLTSTSPTPSGTSDVRVGIALSTPPLHDDPEAAWFPAHPYAQGGLHNYTHAVNTPTVEQHYQKGSSYAGPHPSLASGSQPINHPDASSRHRLPPHVASHPYAQVSPDLYLSDRKIIREDSNIPPAAKMWAQWSPGVLREILPNEIQYSPFISENGDHSARNSKVIYDTVGVGEALAYAVRPKTSRDSGLGTSEDRTDEELVQQGIALSSPPKRSYRQPVMYDASRPSYLSQKPSEPSSGHTFASSPIMPLPPAPKRNEFWSMDDIRAMSTSPGMISENSSPPQSPKPFGNPDDLGDYHDLFYRPSTQKSGQPVDAPTMSSSPIPWDTGSYSRRTGSGLTNLARQLSAELIRDQENSQYSDSSMSIAPRAPFTRRPTDSSLEFVFEQSSLLGRNSSASPPDHSNISTFHPSVNIPEDVGSSRASSPTELLEDPTERYRVGLVESVSTPPAIFSDRRESFMGQMSSANDESYQHTELQDLPSPTNPSLHPPSTEATRSSYMTTSTGSGMSRLSDFPAPPREQQIARMSLLSSYFEGALTNSESHAPRSPTPPIPLEVQNDRRLTFGKNEDIEELVAALSSHDSDSSHS